jgi:hypothetical protein
MRPVASVAYGQDYLVLQRVFAAIAMAQKSDRGRGG